MAASASKSRSGARSRRAIVAERVSAPTEEGAGTVEAMVEAIPTPHPRVASHVAGTRARPEAFPRWRILTGERLAMEPIDQITCADLISRLPDFLDGEVLAAERAALAAHLDRCAHCLATYRFERHLLTAVKLKLRTTDVPDDLTRRITVL